MKRCAKAKVSLCSADFCGKFVKNAMHCSVHGCLSSGILQLPTDMGI